MHRKFVNRFEARGVQVVLISYRNKGRGSLQPHRLPAAVLEKLLAPHAPMPMRTVYREGTHRI